MLEDNMLIEGRILLREGKARNVQVDEKGNVIDWQFYASKEIDLGKNVICKAGMDFILSRSWGIPMVIAVGNGLVTGANAPVRTDTQLQAELENARFGVRGNALTRFQEGTATLSALWNRGQGYGGAVTEWGLFCAEDNFPIQGKNTGFLTARRASAYSKNVSSDVEIVWVIKYVY